jgi:hypothetical protein
MNAKPFKLQARVRGFVITTLVFSVFTNLLMLTGPLFMLQVYDRSSHRDRRRRWSRSLRSWACSISSTG